MKDYDWFRDGAQAEYCVARAAEAAVSGTTTSLRVMLVIVVYLEFCSTCVTSVAVRGCARFLWVHGIS